MNVQNKYFTTIIATMLVMGSLLYIVVALQSDKIIDKEGSGLTDLRYSQELTIDEGQEFIIDQKFVSTKDNVTHISFPYAGRVSNLTLSLMGENNLEIATHYNLHLDSGGKKNATFNWAFPPIKYQSSGYLVRINGLSEGITFYLVQKNYSDAGALTINNEPSNFVFVLDWEYYERTPLIALFTRYAIGKFGIFNFKATSVVLSFVIMFLSIGVVFGFIFYKNEERY